jgi:hypothetical protein
MDKGYPSAKKLVSQGVPHGLATALAPFQRGGVDFVIEKGGRALIADGKEMFVIASWILCMNMFADVAPVSFRNSFL